MKLPWKKKKPPAPRLRVLFVDDESAVLQTWRYAFEHVFDVECALGPDLALARIEQLQTRGMAPNVLVVDQRMPGMTGVELCRRAREILPQVACLIATGYDDCTLSNGFYAVVRKPLDNNAFIETIKSVAAGKGPSSAELRQRLVEIEAVEDAARADLKAATKALHSWRPAAAKGRS